MNFSAFAKRLFRRTENNLRKSRLKILIVIIFSVIASMLLSGCILRISADDLYRLPQVSEDYLRLQGHINAIINEGAEFAPPISGPNRQSVQLKDLTGNGINEVIAFFRIPGYSTLKIYVFEMIDGDYSVAMIIEGAGTAIESIRYVDMNGDGNLEIIVGWQLGDALKYMEIYSIIDFDPQLLAGAEYEGISIFDINNDRNDDIIIVRLPTPESSAIAKIFTLCEDRDIQISQVNLSAGIETISRVIRGTLIGGEPAIFIESEGRFYEGSFITDVLALRNDEFTNISLRQISGISEQTVRQRRILSADLGGDNIIKIPSPRRLYSPGETAYYVMDWYSFAINGASRLEMTTYHNPIDEWFLILPLDWRERVAVRREDVVSGERTVIFSYIPGVGGSVEDFLSIHRLTGDARESRSALPGRVRLTSEGTVVYAFELLAPKNSFGLTFDEETISENFRLIFSDWLAGTF